MTLDLTGCKIGEVLVIKKHGRKYEPKSQHYRTLWECVCSCGKTIIRQTGALTRKKVIMTCGHCNWKIHHSDAYTSWYAMRRRCNNKNAVNYHRYGGRGITICESWGKFVNFYYDMGDPPYDLITRKRMSLDRIDNEGNYEPSNCKWSTYGEQRRNQ